MAEDVFVVDLRIMRFSSEVQQVCTVCGKNVSSGRYLIFTDLYQGKLKYRYIVGTNNLTCCDHSFGVVWRLFDSKSEADSVRRIILDQILVRKTTKGLPLIAWVTPF